MTVFLCGFMGCGKTTAGKLAAEKAGLPFTDLDQYIENSEKTSISEIFADPNKGESYFRKLETAAIKETAEKSGIVALGGGAIIKPENADIINSLGVSVFLDCEFATCYERIKSDPNRPLAKQKSQNELETLYYERKSVYGKHAAITVDANTDADTLAERIISIAGI